MKDVEESRFDIYKRRKMKLILRIMLGNDNHDWLEQAQQHDILQRKVHLKFLSWKKN